MKDVRAFDTPCERSWGTGAVLRPGHRLFDAWWCLHGVQGGHELWMSTGPDTDWQRRDRSMRTLAPVPDVSLPCAAALFVACASTS